MTAVRERLEFQAGGTRALIRENGRAGRPLNDGHVAGSSKVLPPLAPYVCWFAVSLDAVKGEIAVRTFEREGEVRQRGGCGKLGRPCIEKLECIGNVLSIKLGECDRPSRSVACRREILGIEGYATPSPY